MNFAGIIGVLSAIAIATFAVLDATSNPKIFLDVHGIVIVLGGTLTVALLSFRFSKLVAAIKVLFRKMLGNERDDFQGIIRQIAELSEVYQVNPKNLAAALPAKSHPFLKDAVGLITNYGFNVQELDEILSNAIKGKKKRDEEELKVWHTVSRFPPAFGLLGATLGMISLLQTLG
ncbi:MAG TPA: MotA/TolQ/ExbB proton channel family protein, partial [Pseudobdellovibrionaceae bacterium]|nr:MotA/TolQ/ExbB proton channel family protein [Pseudobdellovibrionaceae bacterium]